jgi:hypothetical protein
MVTPLPPELVEAIIAHLDDDAAALRACALVCLVWVPISQQHIFRTIVVHGTPETRPLSHLRDHAHLRALVVNLEWRTSHACSPDKMASFFPRVRHLLYDNEVPVLLWTIVSSLPALETVEIGPLVSSEDFLDTEDMSSEVGIDRASCCQLPIVTLRLADAWVLGSVRYGLRTDVLRILEFPFPYAADQSKSWLPPFLTSLTALEDLKINIWVFLKGLGKIWVANISQMCADLHLSDLNLGVVTTRTLRLTVYPDREAVPFIFGLLRLTAFPRLCSLFIELEAEDLQHLPHEDNIVVFDPFHAGGASDHTVQQWVIDRSLAARLECVHISLPRIDVLLHATEFSELFGAANRPGVLRVLPERVRLEE